MAVDVDLPRDGLVVIAGLSGSGKSSLGRRLLTPSFGLSASSRATNRPRGTFWYAALYCAAFQTEAAMTAGMPATSDDLSCAMVNNGLALPWQPHWQRHCRA
jgi:hypothetical protein